MKINKPWEFEECQHITIQNKKYNIHSAIFLARNIQPVSVEIKYISRDMVSPCYNRFMDFCEHVKAVNEAELKYPILMNEDGAIIDGRHRLAKAIISERKNIMVRKFEKDPRACYEYVNND